MKQTEISKTSENDVPRVCVLNIGNSNVQMFFTGGAQPPELRSIPTECFSLDMVPENIPAAAATVVPRFVNALKDRGIFLVTRETPCNIDLSGADTSTLGTDRIANMVQLAASGSVPAMSIDCGTAVNAEIVSADLKFKGGAIFPGRTLMRKSLHLYTSQLPEIPFFEDLPDFPGTNTQDAIRYGTDEVLLAGIERLIAKTAKLFPGEQLRVVFCGGDRKFFLQHVLEKAEDGGETFTLRGIETIFRKNLK